MDNRSYLSKSLFIRGLQCHKSLWLHKHCPEARDEISDSRQAIFQSGTDVGVLAQQLLPGGKEIPYDGLSHSEQVARTRDEILKGTTTIYEATFSHDDIFVKVDILHRGERGWEILEVKASTAVKGVHLNDTALQYHVLNGAGLKVAKAAVVHINNGYTRQGELALDELFVIVDVTVDVLSMQQQIPEEIARQRAMLGGEIPAIDIGPHCDDPYECDFSGHCWNHIPEDSVFGLRGRGVDKFALYRQGIVRQDEIPLDMLNNSQRYQVESTLNKANSVNTQAVREFLDSLWFPLCYLDFETINPAVPSFDGCRPYQQMSVQYSLHIQQSREAEIEHYEFLAEPGIDPREEIACSLVARIPEDACILAWYQPFEKGVLRGLAELFPQFSCELGQRIENFRDLMVPFRNRDIYFWQSRGAYSIKAILPLMAPELSYKGMTVANGGDAMDAFYQMCGTDDPVERAELRTALLEYCKLDTLAMVRILERMRAIASLG